MIIIINLVRSQTGIWKSDKKEFLIVRNKNVQFLKQVCSIFKIELFFQSRWAVLKLRMFEEWCRFCLRERCCSCVRQIIFVYREFLRCVFDFFRYRWRGQGAGWSSLVRIEFQKFLKQISVFIGCVLEFFGGSILNIGVQVL